MGDKEGGEEVVREESVTKDVAEDADASTSQNTHYQSGNSREKCRILERF